MAGNEGIFTKKEFYNRGVIKLAPDVLVYIGGALDMQIIAPVTNKEGKLSFNDGITSVSVQNTIDPPGGSRATIEINTPIYGENSKYWVEYPGGVKGTVVRAPVFVPMMEVKIFFKGRFLVEEKTRYYPAFWGFIMDVEENFSGGIYKITLNCCDILHWWAYSTINVHPVPASNIMAGGGQKLTVFSTIFGRQNPFEIITTLTKNMGMHEFVTVAWPGQMTPLQSIYPADLFKKITAGIMSYWQQRFANIASLLKLYGLSGNRVDSKGIEIYEPSTIATSNIKKSDAQEGVESKDQDRYQTNLDVIRKFETFADYGDMGKFDNAEFMTKLDIATTIKNRVNYEFYQDVDGNFIFKPPFYNLNVKGILPYTLLPNEIINYSLSSNSDGIVTVLTVTTPFYKNLRQTSFGLGKGFHMDIELSKRYGTRHKEIVMEYIANPQMARSLALGEMAVINAQTITGTVSIPGRPEMRLGYPVYIEHKDSFHYVKSIGHTFDYGGSFTTTLGLEIERKKIYVPSIAVENLETHKETAVNIEAKESELKKYNQKNNKNKEIIKKLNTEIKTLQELNIALTDTIKEELVGYSKDWVLLKDAVYRLNNTSVPESANKNDPPPLWATDPDEKKKQDMLAGEQRIISMQQGRYDLSLRDPLKGEAEKSATLTTVPYTDEDGYQTIGSFPYGRNVNAVCVITNTDSLPVLKEVYLTTMARPVYKSESDSMGILFFDDKEGAVPLYINTASNPVSKILGVLESDIDLDKKQELDYTQTDFSTNLRETSFGTVKAVTNMTVHPEKGQ